ncbi:MAG: tRNA uracil 4-sulfurtransferase ThiI [Candidatus Bathyarchaeia archaeon]
MHGRVTLVSYSEVALKSATVRRRLERMLMGHIKNTLQRESLSQALVERTHGRLIVRGVDPEKAATLISKVFGVASTMPAIEISTDLETIVKTSVEVAASAIEPNKTFAIRARRAGDHPYTSRDIEAEAGEAVLQSLADRGVRVNLEAPDTTIHVEARPKAAYVYSRVLRGPSGLPYGSQGRLVALFSGGIDSPVACWMMMKRGAHVVPLFLDQRPFVGDDYVERVLRVAGKIRGYVPLKAYHMYMAPTGEIMSRIVERVPKRLICVVCKRMMYRIACRVAETGAAYGIVTGESLGQVASQTLANLRVLDEASSLPVYRPLIGLDKNETAQMAREIGTYDISAVSVHGCAAVPSKPATKARIGAVRRAEERVDVEQLISEALKGLSKVLL